MISGGFQRFKRLELVRLFDDKYRFVVHHFDTVVEMAPGAWSQFNNISRCRRRVPTVSFIGSILERGDKPPTQKLSCQGGTAILPESCKVFAHQLGPDAAEEPKLFGSSTGVSSE